MCGIVGYVGSKNSRPSSSTACASLEYRGYDSAGLAIHDGQRSRSSAPSASSRTSTTRSRSSPLAGTTGIGHTRWATHGRPSEANAHPHVAGDGRGRPQRHHREPRRRSAASSRAEGVQVRRRHRHRDRRAPDRPRAERSGAKPLRGRAQRRSAACAAPTRIAVVSRNEPDAIVVAQARLAARRSASARARCSAAATSPRSSRTRAT